MIRFVSVIVQLIWSLLEQSNSTPRADPPLIVKPSIVQVPVPADCRTTAFPVVPSSVVVLVEKFRLYSSNVVQSYPPLSVNCLLGNAIDTFENVPAQALIVSPTEAAAVIASAIVLYGVDGDVPVSLPA